MTGAALARRARRACRRRRARLRRVLRRRGEPRALALDPLRPELMFRAGWSARRSVGARGERPWSAAAAAATRCARRCRACSRSRRASSSMPTRSTRSRPTPVCSALPSARAGRGLATILTPHPLEAARLLGEHDRRGAGRPAGRRARARGALSRGRRAEGLGNGRRRPGRGRRASTPPATRRWPAPAPATSSPAGSAAAGRRPARPPSTVATRGVIEHGAAAEPAAPRSDARRRPDRGAAPPRARLSRAPARAELSAAPASPCRSRAFLAPRRSRGTVSPARSEIASKCATICSRGVGAGADVHALRQRDVGALERAGAGAQDGARRRVFGDQREQARRHRAGLEHASAPTRA